jgi:tol-pal system protein YbgF
MTKLHTSWIGVMSLLLMTVTPFSFSAQSPIAIESREVAPVGKQEDRLDVQPSVNQAVQQNAPLGRTLQRGGAIYQGGSTLPYQPPIEDEFEPQSGGETQYQVQLLQQEVQDLRGQVEELTFQLGQMRQTQNDRYLELDARFQRLTNRTPESAIADEAEPDAVVVVAGEDEKTLYDNAVELIRARQYELAISQLEAVIDRHPDGAFTANAYYWLGEVYAAKSEPDYEAARQALAQVITFFPNHRKVPDAAFKLGMVYHMIGDCARAAEILNQVINQHQATTVAKLASDYLRDRIGSCN